MPRYIALLRGVSPQNAKMPDLKWAFESAGFTNVRTILSSGNVIFDAAKAKESTLEQRAEVAMQEVIGRSFYTIVRLQSDVQAILAADTFSAFDIPADAKRVVSFMRNTATPKVKLPYIADGAQILTLIGREAYTAYVPSADGPIFMKMIEQTFGKDVTTRTWDTVKKCALG
jgi:uncharacterized protein (DUF1697 family)